MADGLMPPKILLVQVVSQAGNIAAQKAEDTPFAIPTTQFPKEFSAADQARLRNGVLAAIRDSVLPDLREIHCVRPRRVRASSGRLDIGTWALPDGAARYAFDVRRSTTTNMTPDEIHQLGLARSRASRRSSSRSQRSWASPISKSFRDSIPKMPSLHPKSREQILDEYRHYIAQMTAALARAFRPTPEGKARGSADRAVPREGSIDVVQPGHARRLAPGPRFRQHLRFRQSAHNQQRIDRVPRRCSRTPHADLDRAGAAGDCRRSVSRPTTRHTSRAGPCTPSDSARRSDSTRIRTSITAASTTRCCARSAWWSTPASTTSTGRASRSSNSSATTRARTSRPAVGDRPLHRLAGQALAYKVGQLTILRLRDQARRSSAQSSTSARSTTSCSAPARCRWMFWSNG